MSEDSGENKSGISQVVENEVVITDSYSTSIAEIFNRYFIETSTNFAIPPVTENDVLELLMSVPFHKATGDDGIGIKILKIAAPGIVPSLTRVLNLCLTKKHFSMENCKSIRIAHVSPIPHHGKLQKFHRFFKDMKQKR